ncbi:orotate phosphoribosyltransferase [Alicyclobacillus cycloheptanicus]|nr:orotate phosphoribosyltransferase [Alicyclobacillus cycloheptanicus]
MLQIGAVEIRTQDLFRWSSGWRSPIYCDNRLILGYPVLRGQVLEGFEAIVTEAYPGVDLIAGTATAGIPHAAALADRLGLPMAYVRSSAKGHGKQKRVEGKVFPGAAAIVVEDTLSTGTSAYDAVAALEEEGVRVLGVITIFSYDFEAARTRIRAAGVPAHRLVDYDTLVSTAVDQGVLGESDVAGLMAWRKNPETYGQEG